MGRNSEISWLKKSIIWCLPRILHVSNMSSFMHVSACFCFLTISKSLVWVAFSIQQGAESPQPVDGITGYECPRGTYCPTGSSFPVGCAPGSYNPSVAMEECTTCTAGSVCPGNSTAPEECPIYHYCPAGSAVGTPCPAGTYGERVSARAEFCDGAPQQRNIPKTDCFIGHFYSSGAMCDPS